MLAYGTTLNGLASHADHLLITVEDGVVELDPHRSRLRRRLALTGCEGNPFVAADGSLLIARRGGIVRLRTDVVESPPAATRAHR